MNKLIALLFVLLPGTGFTQDENGGLSWPREIESGHIKMQYRYI